MNPAGRGQRIARARRRRGLSQAALAGLIGRSESWLSQVERGLRQVDSNRVLQSLAEVLRVDVTELTGNQPAERQSRYTAAAVIERAMMAYDGLESVISGEEADRPLQVDHLILALDRVNRTYQAARYEEAGHMLPALIRAVEITVRTCPRRDSIRVSKLSRTIVRVRMPGDSHHGTATSKAGLITVSAAVRSRLLSPTRSTP